MYTIEFSKAALVHITKNGYDQFNNNYCLVLVDSHCCGGIVEVEIHPDITIQNDPNMRLLFSQNDLGFSFNVYAESQAIRDDALPNQILIDLKILQDTEKLEMKNGSFEKPYETY